VPSGFWPGGRVASGLLGVNQLEEGVYKSKDAEALTWLMSHGPHRHDAAPEWWISSRLSGQGIPLRDVP